MIHILDAQTDELKGFLDNQGGLFWHDVHEQDLSGVNTFSFTTHADEYAEHIDKRTRLLIPADSGGWMEFITHLTINLKDRSKEVHALGAEIELNNYKIIEPKKHESIPVERYLTLALEGTGYEIGQVDYSGIRTLTFDKALGAYTFIRRIATAFELEPRFRIATKGGRITHRYVDLVKSVGLDTKKEIVHGKDLLGIERTVHSDRIVTALYCVGPEKDDGSRLTTLVKDENAFQRWNREGRHIIDIYEPESERTDMTLKQLEQYGRTELKKRIDAVAEYTVDFATIEHLFPHETVLLGDKVRIKDTEFVPPLYAEARILNIKRSISDKSKKESVIGNVYEIPEKDVFATFKKMQDKFQTELAKLLMVSVQSSAGDVFKNGEGITTLTADLRLNGQPEDVDGTAYTYTWYKSDKNGLPVLPYEGVTGKTLTITAADIQEKATYRVKVENEKVSTHAQITISNVFDGSPGAPGADGLTLYTWTMYADDDMGNGMTDIPDGKRFVGHAYNKQQPTPSPIPSDYIWTLRGDIDISGENLVSEVGVELVGHDLAVRTQGQKVDSRTYKILSSTPNGTNFMFRKVKVKQGGSYVINADMSDVTSGLIGVSVYDKLGNLLEVPDLLSGDLLWTSTYRGYFVYSDGLVKPPYRFKVVSDQVGYIRFRIGVYRGNLITRDVLIRNPEFREGSKAIGWSPAPEDLVTIDKTYTNGLRFDESLGLIVERSDGKARSIQSATEGFSLERKVGNAWRKNLWADLDGNINFSGNLDGAGGTFSGTVQAKVLRVENPNVEQEGVGGIWLQVSKWQADVNRPFIKTGHIEFNTNNNALELNMRNLSGAIVPMDGFTVNARFTRFDGNLEILGQLYTNAVDAGTASGYHVYLRPKAGMEVRATETGTTDRWVNFRASTVFANALDINTGTHVYARPSAAGGNLRVTATGTTDKWRSVEALSFIEKSLEKYKQDIVEWNSSGLEVIRNSKLWKYRRRDDVANGILTLRHGLVIGAGYGTPDVVLGDDGTSVSLSSLCYFAWKAIQEMDKDMSNLKDELNWFKIENQYLKQKVGIV